jgi:hypothetical protein
MKTGWAKEVVKILKLLIKVPESWATRLNLSFAEIGDQIKIAQLDKGKGWSL